MFSGYYDVYSLWVVATISCMLRLYYCVLDLCFGLMFGVSVFEVRFLRRFRCVFAGVLWICVLFEFPSVWFVFVFLCC